MDSTINGWRSGPRIRGGEEESLQDKYFPGNILMAHFYCNLNDSPESFKVGETSAFNLGKLSIFSFVARHWLMVVSSNTGSGPAHQVATPLAPISPRLHQEHKKWLHFCASVLLCRRLSMPGSLWSRWSMHAVCKRSGIKNWISRSCSSLVNPGHWTLDGRPGETQQMYINVLSWSINQYMSCTYLSFIFTQIKSQF